MNNTSFFQIVVNSGGVGIIIWLWLFIFSFLGIVLGIVSVANSIQPKADKYPLAFKLLFCCMAATLFTGAMSTVTGYVDSFAGLATATGAEKAAILRLCLSQSRVSLYFAFGAVFIQLIFAGISWGILQTKMKQFADRKKTSSEQIRSLPIFIYAFIIVSIPVGIGIYFCLWGIEKIVLLKPGENLSLCLGMEYSALMKVCFLFGLLGIFVSLILLIQTIVKHIQTKKGASFDAPF